MCDSGARLDWPGGAPILDKHSTGGVGDCTSLVLAPALAACGARVPMISGRGLGHTGGTLDKLDAIPGVDTGGDAERLRAVVGAAGCAILGAGAEIAPADRRLYAIRDVSGTVDSVDLITASILSKKLAAGLQGLVLDVKVGSGAFMKDIAAARALGGALVDTANAAGCPTLALLTDMDSPLAPALGNALEVRAALDVLTGAAHGPLRALVIELGGAALALGGLSPTLAAGAEAIAQALDTGQAAERFRRMIAAMGGPADLFDRADGLLPRAPVVRDVPAPAAGHIAAIDGEALGRAVVALGGGRAVESDRIDPSVGLDRVAPLGTRVEPGDPLALVHAADAAGADRAATAVAAAIRLSEAPVAAGPLVLERIG
jgi:thymidine phosphorylase